MRIAISIIGVLASLVLLAASAFMNYLFMASLGQGELESRVLGAASVGADVLKSVLPFFMAWAFINRRYVFAGLSGILFVGLIGLSLLSATNFILGARTAIAGTQDELNADYKGAQDDLRTATAAFDKVAPHRPRNVVAGELETEKTNRRWQTTNNCADPTIQASKLYCDGIARLQAELQAAIEHERLARNITRLKQEIEKQRAVGAGRDGDRQVGLLARVFKVERDWLTLAINGFIAIVIELGSDFGLFFATSWGAKSAAPRRTEDTAAPVAEPIVLEVVKEAPELNREEVAEQLASYCVERLHPAQGRTSVAVMDIYADYVVWCEKGRQRAGSIAAFLGSFATIAETAGLSIKGTACQNVRVGPRMGMLAAS